MRRTGRSATANANPNPNPNPNPNRNPNPNANANPNPHPDPKQVVNCQRGFFDAFAERLARAHWETEWEI